MKKTILSLIALALSAGAMAEIVIPNVVGISFESNNGIRAQSNWYEAADADDSSWQNGKDVTALNLPAGDGVSDTEIFIYCQASYGDMASLYTTQLAGKHITIRTNTTETNYKFVFTSLYPETLDVKLVDHEADSIITIVKNAEYAFTAPMGQTISNRFQFYQAPTGTPAICHQYGQLQITNYEGDVVVKDMSNNPVLTEHVIGSEDIDLSTLADGHYQVEFNGTKFIISVNPEVTIVP